jgi:Protein of unknown function (DUF3185)
MENVKKPLGGALIVIGIICAFWGVNRMNSPVSQVAGLIGQSDSAGTAAVVVGGSGAIAGTILLFIGQGKKE